MKCWALERKTHQMADLSLPMPRVGKYFKRVCVSKKCKIP